NALPGGQRVCCHTEGGRAQVTYRQERPAKSIPVAVGRLAEVAPRPTGAVPMHVFSVGRTRGEAADILDDAAEMLRFYEEEFGRYPYGSLTVVVVEGRTPGGHSPPGMVILAQRPVLLRHGCGPIRPTSPTLPG